MKLSSLGALLQARAEESKEWEIKKEEETCIHQVAFYYYPQHLVEEATWVSSTQWHSQE